MVRQFFAQTRDLFGSYRTGAVPPLAPFVSQNVGNFLIGQCFVPRLHDRTAEFLAFNRDRSLQTFENDHCRSLRTASRKFRAGQRRILSGNTETVRLVASLAVGRENLFASVAGRKFSLLLLSLRSATFFGRWRSAERIESVTGKISGVATEVSAAGENRDPVNSDQPDRKRLEADARFAFLALNRGVHFLNVGRFAIIHPLAGERRGSWSLVVHFFGGAGAGDPAGAAGGEPAGGAAPPGAVLTSLSGCD